MSRNYLIVAEDSLEQSLSDINFLPAIKRKIFSQNLPMLTRFETFD